MSKKYKFPSEFLELVRTMPWVEAEEMLRDRKREVLQRLHEANGGQETVDLGYVLAAINEEIHIISKKQQAVGTGRAIRDLFGEEGYARWREYWARSEERTKHPKVDISL